MGLISKVVSRVEKDETAATGESPPGALQAPEVPKLSAMPQTVAPRQTPPPPRRNRWILTLLVICLAMAGLAVCGYVFLTRPASETPVQPTRESISSRRQRLKSTATAPPKEAAAQPGGVAQNPPAKPKKGAVQVEEASFGTALKTEANRQLVRAPGLPSIPGGYTIQLLASADRSTAEGLASRVIADGYGGYVQKHQIPGKGTIFRVRVGAYPSRWEARAAMAKIAQKYSTEAWIDYYLPAGQAGGEGPISSLDKAPVSPKPQGKAASGDSPKEQPNPLTRKSPAVGSKTAIPAAGTQPHTAENEDSRPPEVSTPSGSAKREQAGVERTSPKVETKARVQPKAGSPTTSTARRGPPEKGTSNQVVDSKEPASQQDLAARDRADSRAQRYCNKGVSYQQEGELESAAESYRKALGFDPDNRLARLNLATAYMQMGRLKEAEREFVSLYASKPDDCRVLYNLGLLLYRFGEYSSAEAKLGELLRIDPLHLEANLLLASIYEQWGEREKALEYCMNAYRIDSVDSRVLYRLGRILDGAGEIQEAVKYYRLFLSNSPEADGGLRLVVRDRLNYLVTQPGGVR